MSKTRTTLISAIAIGLLAGSTVGVVAQDAVTDQVAPVEFTGATSFGPRQGDYSVNPILQPFTDPRLGG